MSCQTGCLVRVIIGRSDVSHKAYFSFHAIPKTSRTFNISAVMIMGINKSINEANYLDSMLDASKKYMGDQIMKKMIFP